MKKYGLQNPNLKYFLLFSFILISRIPFIKGGYGIEEDSWGIALEAFRSHFFGKYIPSRFPGHPTQELLLTLLYNKGAIVFNLLSAIFSAIGTVLFALILKHFNFHYSFLGAMAFAFIPVYFISSTYTIDFVWSETFVLAAFYFLLKDKLIFAGCMLGFAVGCRITSGIFLIPFMIIIWQQNNLKENLFHFLKIAIPMKVFAIVLFMPIILQSGLSFLMYYDQFAYPPISKVVYKSTIGVFGAIGTMALLSASLIILFKNKKTENGKSFSEKINKKIIFASFLLILLFLVSYFRLPQKSGYIIPTLPFVILLLGYYLNTKTFKLICLLFISSSFICDFNLTDKLRGAKYSSMAYVFNVSGQEIFFDAFSGPIFSDISKRKQKTKYVGSVLLETNKIRQNTVIISGWWYNQIMVTQNYSHINKFVIFEPYINEEKIKNYVKLGYSIYYLPEQNNYNDEMYNMSITNKVSRPFKIN